MLKLASNPLNPFSYHQKIIFISTVLHVSAVNFLYPETLWNSITFPCMFCFLLFFLLKTIKQHIVLFTVCVFICTVVKGISQ